MNSPPDPGSPSLSTPSSGTGSPPPEEIHHSSGGITDLASRLSSFIPGSSKRRLPGSSYATSSSRDPKSRRREDPRRGNSWADSKEAKREKEELVDNQYMETLKKKIGDPFQEDFLKAS